MNHICPRSCGGLIVAAVFIAASVVQLIAGLMLLRSEYAFILSGPNFWIAAMNVIVGCLLGVSTNVWKHNERQKLSIFIRRFKLIVALQVSAMIANATTCAILILSEGTALLSIIIERHVRNSAATMNSEFIGYAFAASVVSPALCIAVCAASLAVNCCPERTPRKIATPFQPAVKSIHKNTWKSPDYFQWVYTPEDYLLDKASLKSFTELSEDSDDYGFTPTSLYFASPTEQKSNSRYGFQKSTHTKELNSSWEEVEICSQCFTTPTTSVTSPMMGEVVPVRLGNKSVCRLGKLVSSPVPPDHWSSETMVKTPILSSFTPSPSVNEKFLPVPKSHNHGQKSPSYIPSIKILQEELSKRCSLKEERVKGCEIRGDKIKSVRPMAAIIEDAQETHQDDHKLSSKSPSTKTSGYGSSPEIPGSSSQLPTPPPRLTSKLSTQHTEPLSKKRLFQENQVDSVEEDVWI